MRDIDFIQAKNSLEIAIYDIQNKYEGKDIPMKAERTLSGLILAFRVLMAQDNDIEILKKQILSIKLQNINAYKETAQLKKRVSKIL
jgi:hypothetical protein